MCSIDTLHASAADVLNFRAREHTSVNKLLRKSYLLQVGVHKFASRRKRNKGDEYAFSLSPEFSILKYILRSAHFYSVRIWIYRRTDAKRMWLKRSCYTIEKPEALNVMIRYWSYYQEWRCAAIKVHFVHELPGIPHFVWNLNCGKKFKNSFSWNYPLDAKRFKIRHLRICECTIVNILLLGFKANCAT
jgi:hypothetical protein